MRIHILALGSPALMLALGMAIAGTPTAAQEEAQTRELNQQQGMTARAPSVAEAAPVMLSAQTAPLNQIDNIPEQVATARVTDASGKVIGAVQKVEIQNGRPTHVDITLMGSDTLVGLDAATLRYDAPNNVVATSETLAQLMARPRT